MAEWAGLWPTNSLLHIPIFKYDIKLEWLMKLNKTIYKKIKLIYISF